MGRRGEARGGEGGRAGGWARGIDGRDRRKDEMNDGISGVWLSIGCWVRKNSVTPPCRWDPGRFPLS